MDKKKTIAFICGGSSAYKFYSQIFGKYKIRLYINGFDNGKSTGLIRSLFPDTLGMSDFRKNLVKLLEMSDSDLAELLETRALVKNIRIDDLAVAAKKIFGTGLEAEARQVVERCRIFADEHFAIGNILLQSAAIKYGGMSGMLQQLNTAEYELISVTNDDNYFLFGCGSSRVWYPEEDIVDQYITTDIIDIKLQKYNQVDSPGEARSSPKIAVDADIAIIGPGTFYSSTFPSLKFLDFASCKDVYLVENAAADFDNLHLTAEEMLVKTCSLVPEAKLIQDGNLKDVLQ